MSRIWLSLPRIASVFASVLLLFKLNHRCMAPRKSPLQRRTQSGRVGFKQWLRPSKMVRRTRIETEKAVKSVYTSKRKSTIQSLKREMRELEKKKRMFEKKGDLGNIAHYEGLLTVSRTKLGRMLAIDMTKELDHTYGEDRIRHVQNAMTVGFHSIRATSYERGRVFALIEEASRRIEKEDQQYVRHWLIAEIGYQLGIDRGGPRHGHEVLGRPAVEFIHLMGQGRARAFYRTVRKWDQRMENMYRKTVKKIISAH